MKDDSFDDALRWHEAAGLTQAPHLKQAAPQGAFVPDSRTNRDHVAVVYDKGNPPPEITIRAISGSVQSVLADGVAVAVVAHAAGPGLSAEDVLLVERTV